MSRSENFNSPAGKIFTVKKLYRRVLLYYNLKKGLVSNFKISTAGYEYKLS